MINKQEKEYTLENIYKDLESGVPENKSIKEYAFPNARQWLGGRFFALWVLPIYFISKIAKFSTSSAFIKPYSPSEMVHLISSQKLYLLLWVKCSRVKII